ncbi:MAG: MFS transporter [Aquificaceae bacterium]|nr:MFS transporter [Aquificaceae bacterium]MDW8236886.1 MFS transporter [Aquificaceae bacterium]
MFKDFTPAELRAVSIISFAVAVRMLGIFLLLPVLSPYASSLSGATPALVGLSVGIYGLSQSLLQVPFGYLSDIFGRKPIIAIGLFSYIVGSFMCAAASDVRFLVFGRLVQGVGAVSSAITALSADLIRENVRARAFALIGASIALVFIFSMIASPTLASSFGVPFLFYLTAFFSAIAIFVVIFGINEPQRKNKLPPFSYALKVAISQRLAFFNISVTLLHTYVSSVFTILPSILIKDLGLEKAKHWYIYAPSVIVAVAILLPLVALVEKNKAFRQGFVWSVLSIVFSCLSLLGFKNTLVAIFVLTVFFVGFNLLESTLPSLLLRFVSEESRGAALGWYNTYQFLGVFIGGLLGAVGLALGILYFALISLLIGLIWLIGGLIWFKNARV